MVISVILAIADNNVIGCSGDLPWYLPSDLAHFKKLTEGKTLVMGRKTFDSLPSSRLPGRDLIVVSGDRNFTTTEARIVHASSYEHAAHISDQRGLSETFWIGGRSAFDYAIGAASNLYLTRVHLTPQGDVLYPLRPEREGFQLESSRFSTDSTTKITFETWKRA